MFAERDHRVVDLLDFGGGQLEAERFAALLNRVASRVAAEDEPRGRLSDVCGRMIS